MTPDTLARLQELVTEWRAQANCELYGCCGVTDRQHARALEAIILGATPRAPAAPPPGTRNGGRECDTMEGHCACGELFEKSEADRAWSSAMAHLANAGADVQALLASGVSKLEHYRNSPEPPTLREMKEWLAAENAALARWRFERDQERLDAAERKAGK